VFYSASLGREAKFMALGNRVVRIMFGPRVRDREVLAESMYLCNVIHSNTVRLILSG
jgi:hypothetical protein